MEKQTINKKENEEEKVKKEAKKKESSNKNVSKKSYKAEQEEKNSYKMAKIKVIGVGGAGGKIINRMYNQEGLNKIEFIAVNTDIQDLNSLKIKKKIYAGKNITKGLGAGMNPELGKQAMEESRTEIENSLGGADIVFIVGGLGGGSASFGTSVVADIAKEMGALTIAVATKPFSFEGLQRKRIAEDGLSLLKQRVDTLITIPNDRIFNLIDKDTSVLKAFSLVDDVLNHTVSALTNLIQSPGLVNLDFADVKAIMKDGGEALVGIGIASGENRAKKAAEMVISSPLLETSLEGAKGVLFAVSGKRDLKMSEIDTIAKTIVENVDPGAKIIFGAYFDRDIKPQSLKVTLVATKFSSIFDKGNSLFSNMKNIKIDNNNDKNNQNNEEEKEEDIEKKIEIPSFLRLKNKK